MLIQGEYLWTSRSKYRKVQFRYRLSEKSSFSYLSNVQNLARGKAVGHLSTCTAPSEQIYCESKIVKQIPLK